MPYSDGWPTPEEVQREIDRRVTLGLPPEADPEVLRRLADLLRPWVREQLARREHERRAGQDGRGRRRRREPAP